MLRSLHSWGDWLVFLTVLLLAVLGAWWLVSKALAEVYRPPAIIAGLTERREILNQEGDVSDISFPCVDDSFRGEMDQNGDEQFAAQHLKPGLVSVRLPLILHGREVESSLYCVRPGGWVPAWTLWLGWWRTIFAMIGAVAVVRWLARRFGYAG